MKFRIEMCPYCRKSSTYRDNPLSYVYAVCNNCENAFWMKPSDYNVLKVVGSKPNDKVVLTRDDLKQMIDIALDARDFVMAEEYTSLLLAMHEDKNAVVLSALDDFKIDEELAEC